MLISFWQNAGFSVHYGTLSVLRTDTGGLVAYSWDVVDVQAQEAQDRIGPQMLPSPEPPSPPEPPPPPDPILADIDALSLPVAVKDVLRKLAQR